MYSTESICTNSIRTLLGGGDPRNPSPMTEPTKIFFTTKLLLSLLNWYFINQTQPKV